MADRRSLAIPALAALLLATVAVDVVRRSLERPVPAPAGTTGAEPGPGTAAPQPEASGSLGAAAAMPDGLDSTARSAALRRIEVEGEGTYLPAMLKGGDSALHRWADDPPGRTLRVAVLAAPVPGFREVFVANLAWAVSRWNAVGLPVFLAEASDTVAADIVVTWTAKLDSNRVGRSDVTWRGGGPITHVRITLATHTPEGRAVLPSEMVALALHELGHALGLGHSPLPSDALYPKTSATDLTARDRRTAALLYSLPAGSLK